jgi:HEAT repeat protein
VANFNPAEIRWQGAKMSLQITAENRRIKALAGSFGRAAALVSCGILLWHGTVLAQNATVPASPVDPSGATQDAATPSVAKKPVTSRDRAWHILHEGLEENSLEKRAKAVNALGTLTANAEAEKAATHALTDEKFQVRVAAATALGEMQAVGAIPEMEKALDDVEPTVILAAANSLMTLKDSASAYDIYYGVLTGGMRTNRGLVQEQLKTLHDSKKMAELGLQEGIGFVPFGGVSYSVMKTLMKSDQQSAMRAIAAKRLAHDPDPVSLAALVVATQDRSAMVRAAAVQALAERGDKAQLAHVVLAMDDDKDEVRYCAAAAVIHLSEAGAKRRSGAAGIGGAKTASAKAAATGSNGAASGAQGSKRVAAVQSGTGR